jgi:methyl-accepting chemotaxis protein
MQTPRFNPSSLRAKLIGVTVLLTVASSALIGTNVVLISRLHGNAAKQKLFGLGPAYAYQLLADGYALLEQSGRSRAATVSDMQSVIRANSNRYATLLRGDAQRGIPPVENPQVRASLERRVARWQHEFTPALETVMATSGREDTRSALAVLAPLLTDYAHATLIGADDEERVLTAQLESVRVLQFMFGLVAIIVVACVWRIADRTSRRAEALADVARRISDGELALAAPHDGADELAQLGRAFNAMTGTLRSTIEAEKGARVELQKLFTTIGETAETVASSTAEILQGTTEQASGAQTQASAVVHTVSTVQQVAKAADEAASRARSVAEAASRAVESGETGRRAAEQAVECMNLVHEQTELVARSILELADKAHSIGEVTTTIHDIADRTNVLAVNALIAAAQAGEHGSAFRVVANEVKLLAGQCKVANTRVGSILNEIARATQRAINAAETSNTSVDHAITVVNEAGDTIAVLLQTVQHATNSAMQIVSSALEQSAAMERIQREITKISNTTEQNVVSSKQAEVAARRLSQRGATLMKLVTT